MPPCGVKLLAKLHRETVFWQMLPWDRVNERERRRYSDTPWYKLAHVKLYVYDHWTGYTHSINFKPNDFHGGWSRVYLQDREIGRQCVERHREVWRSGEIAQCVNAKQLMLIPKTIREVERHLLLLATGRAVLVLRQWPSATYYLGL